MRSRSRARSSIRAGVLPGWGPRGTTLLFALAALFLFTFSAINPSGLRGVRTGLTDLFAPVLAVVNYPFAMTAGYVRAVTGLAALQEENMRLQQENERLRTWYHTAMQLKTENDSLQKLLKLRLEPQNTFITARVVADSDSAFVRSVLVMAGKQQGAENAMAVLSGEGVMGRVVEAGNRTARVLLLTDINARIPVLVGGTQIHAVVAGNNTAVPDLVHLPPEAQVQEKDRVITSGDGGIYPYGLPVGEVIRDNDGVLRVKPYADIDNATYVRLVKRADDPNFLPAALEAAGDSGEKLP